ncbi:MAG TPA: general stress protein [Defluviitaleaceae bacterium]|nr:hypothetical protein [Candidatus Epulonipiscium sp.]HOA79636.1 general stress protein [Defluviitaleaceae bacterium]
MDKTIIALFNSKDDAQEAAYELRNQNFPIEDISIAAKSNDNEDQQELVNDDISDGITTGGVLGGIAGLLIGAGTFAIPGLGVLTAAGPLAGLLSGAVTGGIVGGLIDLGIPENQTAQYEEGLKEGKVLLTTKVNEDNVNRVIDILRQFGGDQIELY